MRSRCRRWPGSPSVSLRSKMRSRRCCNEADQRLSDADDAGGGSGPDCLAWWVFPMNEMTTVTTAKDWASDQEVRWCPGCGDYAVLKAVQRLSLIHISEPTRLL